MIKPYAVLLLTVSLQIVVLCIPDDSEAQDEDTFVYEGVEYGILDSGTVEANGLAVAMESLEIPEEAWNGDVKYTVTQIRYGVLGDNEKSVYLQELKIPKTITEFDQVWYPYCENLKTLEQDFDPTRTDYYFAEKNVLFHYDDGLYSLVFYPRGLDQDTYAVPPAVQSIGAYAFQYSEHLEYVYVPKSLTKLEQGQFIHCDSLKEVCIDKDSQPNLMIIGNSQFLECKNLTLGSYGEEGNTLITEAVYIGYDAFNSCTSIGPTVEISLNVVKIEYRAFMNCTGIKEFKVEFNTNYIQDNGCLYEHDMISSSNSATLHTYPAGKTDTVFKVYDKCALLGWYAFSKTQVKEVILNSNFKDIGFSAFSEATNLERITIPESVTAINSGAFNECVNLTTVTMGSKITTIDDSAFYGCTKLESVVLPKSLVEIQNHAFSGSGLKTIVVPESVGKIGNGAFSECWNLTDITLNTTVESQTVIRDFIDFPANGQEEHSDYKVHITGHRGVLDKVEFSSESLSHLDREYFEDKPFPMTNLIGIAICSIFLILFIVYFRRFRCRSRQGGSVLPKYLNFITELLQ